MMPLVASLRAASAQLRVGLTLAGNSDIQFGLPAWAENLATASPWRPGFHFGFDFRHLSRCGEIFSFVPDAEHRTSHNATDGRASSGSRAADEPACNCCYRNGEDDRRFRRAVPPLFL